MTDYDRMPGHWVLATLGKTVLRPGGLQLTQRVLQAAAPGRDDQIVEFGPGVGTTARLLLAAHPASYTAVDPHTEGTAQLQDVLAGHPQARLVVADAASTGLEAESASLVVGEAMLSMCSPAQKQAIMQEAWRILVPGGRYALHELGLNAGVATDDRERSDSSKDISASIKVAARPLPVPAWQQHLEEAGFVVEWHGTEAMRLLSPRRFLADEGVRGTLRFLWRLLRNRSARRRVRDMRASFARQRDHLVAVGFVVRKPR